MKFYSEKLDKLFDSSAELIEAEATSKKKKKATTQVKVEEEVAPSKKQLAAAIDAADDALKEAYANYEAAKAKVEELSKAYLAEVDAILEPAQKAVKAAEQSRYEAIRKFNDQYGAYQVTYTGARAADEMLKAISNLTKSNRLFRDVFWL